MFLRLNRVTRNGRTYQYAHLVESFRRPHDGRPAHRVIKALGTLSDVDIESWQTALRALESGRRIVLAPESAIDAPPPAPLANLRYLDVAVFLELFRQWGLDSLCDELLGRGASDVSPGAVVAALTLQRCVEPGSKAVGARWVARTALPELLGVAPGAFNNTRLHRVLDGLAEVGDGLQSALARRYRERDGAFVSLFLDTSEAIFEGVGPRLAEKNLTKEGTFRRRVCIPLLCNARGYPVQWDVLPGKSADCNVFVDACQALASVSWAQGVPLVLDRAAGTTEVVSHLLDTGLHFLTALVATEKPAYAPDLPCEVLDGLSIDDSAAARDQARIRMERAGLTRITDDLLVHDLGIVHRTTTLRPPRAHIRDASAETGARCRQALELAREIRDAIQSGAHRSLADAARTRNLGHSLAKKYACLLRLAPEIQEAVLQGRAERATLDALVRIAKLPDAQQRDALLRLNRPQPSAPDRAPQADERTVRVRAVAYFNPGLFVDKRATAQRALDRARSQVDALNGRLARSPGSWTRNSAAAAVDRILRKSQLLAVFTVTLHDVTATAPHLRIDLVLDEQKWARRRRYDGFTVLVAHPDIGRTAADLSALYRQREIVEHDFRVIKSLVEIHPVRHRLDHKVKAHVTLCMLALLLERTLRHKLQDEATSEQALEELATCHLNHYGKHGYAITRPTQEQRRLLAALQLTHLIDHDETARRITPR